MSDGRSDAEEDEFFGSGEEVVEDDNSDDLYDSHAADEDAGQDVSAARDVNPASDFSGDATGVEESYGEDGFSDSYGENEPEDAANSAHRHTKDEHAQQHAATVAASGGEPQQGQQIHEDGEASADAVEASIDDESPQQSSPPVQATGDDHRASDADFVDDSEYEDAQACEWRLHPQRAEGCCLEDFVHDFGEADGKVKWDVAEPMRPDEHGVLMTLQDFVEEHGQEEGTELWSEAPELFDADLARPSAEQLAAEEAALAMEDADSGDGEYEDNTVVDDGPNIDGDRDGDTEGATAADAEQEVEVDAEIPDDSKGGDIAGEATNTDDAGDAADQSPGVAKDGGGYGHAEEESEDDDDDIFDEVEAKEQEFLNQFKDGDVEQVAEAERLAAKRKAAADAEQEDAARKQAEEASPPAVPDHEESGSYGDDDFDEEDEEEAEAARRAEEAAAVQTALEKQRRDEEEAQRLVEEAKRRQAEREVKETEPAAADERRHREEEEQAEAARLQKIQEEKEAAEAEAAEKEKREREAQAAEAAVEREKKETAEREARRQKEKAEKEETERKRKQQEEDEAHANAALSEAKEEEQGLDNRLVAIHVRVHVSVPRQQLQPRQSVDQTCACGLRVCSIGKDRRSHIVFCSLFRMCVGVRLWCA